MALSDDEGENLHDVVSEYYFCNEVDEPLSFSVLPVQWNERETSDGSKGQIFLRGEADNGLQKFFKQVMAWKYDLSKSKLEISVLSKDNNWIKLQEPRKSYKNEIRKIMITLHCLHFFKRKPEASEKALWAHLSKVFSSYDTRPSRNDLMVRFIREAVKRDKKIAKPKFIATFLDENHRKRKVLGEDAQITKSSFIVDDMHEESEDDDFTTEEAEDCEPEDDDCTTKEAEDSDSDKEEDVFDSVCAICDNGGSLTCCDGKCLRSFHATLESGEEAESSCETLGLPPELVEGTQPFFCENCRHNMHQCYVCGELGSSDNSSSAEVFQCSSATCGHFYHPKCVVPLLHQQSESGLDDLQVKIAAGEPFTCPAHKCCVCKQGENVKEKDFQFAVCRRCPRSYHRKCLPREIIFDEKDAAEGVTFRAWDKILPQSRVLIYCLDHEIIDDLSTPLRNIKFPGTGHKKKQPSQPLSSKKELAVKERDLSEIISEKRSVPKPQKAEKSPSPVKLGDSSKKRALMTSGPETLKKHKVGEGSKKHLKRNLSTRVERPTSDDGKPSLGSRHETINKGNQAVNSKKECISQDKQTQIVKPPRKENTTLPPVDADSKTRILALMEEATSSITLEEVKKKHIEKAPSTHAHTSRVDKSIRLARVECLVQALRLALKKIEEGCRIEEAMAFCEPWVLDQIMKWKDKLKVYLMPFLHGMRYTSYGRHFTKPEKLDLIAERLCCYAEDGDTIVDFCCGANDFSCIMNKRLEEMGINCSYKNYDFRTAKHDFNFVKTDWMKVSPEKLPPGSQLIMGLNPPFGKNAALANRFIAKALEFKPKLLILIVPRETRRLDKNQEENSSYDLVWEDDRLLEGKAFYLPGSVDSNDKQMDQWNNTAPPLYLWSHPDWTAKYEAIAREHGHAYGVQQVSHSDEALDLPIGDQDVHDQVNEAPALLDSLPTIKEGSERTTQTTVSQSGSRKEDGRDNGSTVSREKFVQEENRSNGNPKKRNRSKGKSGRGDDCLQVERRIKKRSPPRKTETHEILRSDSQFGKDTGKPCDQSMYETNSSHYDTAYNTIQEDDVGLRFDTNLEETDHLPYARPNDAIRGTPDYGIRRGDPVQFPGYAGDNIDSHWSNRDGMDNLSAQEHYVGPSHGTSNFGTRRVDPVQFPGYQTENLNNHSYNRGPYFGEMNSSYGLESQRGGYIGHHYESGVSSRYGYADSSSYNRVNTSAMLRYAPRLDELNPSRMNHLRTERYEQRYDQSVPGPGFRVDSSGFAPGSYHSYTHHNASGGWIND